MFLSIFAIGFDLLSSITVLFDIFLCAEMCWSSQTAYWEWRWFIFEPTNYRWTKMESLWVLIVRWKAGSQQKSNNQSGFDILLSILPFQNKDVHTFIQPKSTAGLNWTNCGAWCLCWRAHSPQTPIIHSNFDIYLFLSPKFLISFEMFSSIKVLFDSFCNCRGVMVSQRYLLGMKMSPFRSPQTNTGLK